MNEETGKETDIYSRSIMFPIIRNVVDELKLAQQIKFLYLLLEDDQNTKRIIWFLISYTNQC